MLLGYLQFGGTCDAAGLGGKKAAVRVSLLSSLVSAMRVMPSGLVVCSVGIHDLPPSVTGFARYLFAEHSSPSLRSFR